MVDSTNPTDTVSQNSPINGTANAEAVLLTNVVSHHFSSPNSKDLFQLYVIGESIKDGHVTFQILSSSGQILFNETFEANLLIGYGLTADNPTDNEQEGFIKKRVDEFFSENNFHRPAIGKADTFDEDYSELEIWNDIKSDTSAIGFHYLIGEENDQQVAYSKKSTKVVVYFSCC